MAKTIVANIMPEETRMAILEDGELMEVAVERSESGHLVGNIYKGRIANILPGMQAAFIDIGWDKNAFLYIGDIFLPTKHNGSGGNGFLSVGQEIIVQIAKDAIGSKGPRATTHLTLPGRYVVLMPTVNYIGVSRRINDEAERERLRQIAERIRPPEMGIIVRTVAAGKNEEDFRRDLEYLVSTWQSLAARAKRAKAPVLLYRDVDLVIRIVRDYLSADVDEFFLDDRDAFSRVRDLLSFISPELESRVKLYEGRDDIFTHFGIEAELNKLQKRRVDLKCGGYIIIDNTEALTVIDVNTGKFVGQTNLADTVFKTNLEAAAEIARQLRLRDIGGIIIIDFIDMDSDEHKQALLEALNAALKKDRTKTNVVGLTGLGLVEMTRKKARQNITSVMYAECPCCQGLGRVYSPETVAINIKRQLRKLAKDPSTARSLILQVTPRIAQVLTRPGELERLEQETCCSIKIEAIDSMGGENYLILAGKD